MVQIARIIIFICLIACVASHLHSVSSFEYSKSKTSTDKIKEFNGKFYDRLKNSIDSLFQNLKNVFQLKQNSRNFSKLHNRPPKTRYMDRKNFKKLIKIFGRLRSHRIHSVYKYTWYKNFDQDYQKL